LQTGPYITRLLSELLTTTLFTIESITAWRQSMNNTPKHIPPLNSANTGTTTTTAGNHSTNPPPRLFFRYRNVNYLTAMLTDTAFIATLPLVTDNLPPATSYHRNPFFLAGHNDIDSLNRVTGHITDVTVSRARVAARVVLAEEKEESKARQLAEIEHQREATYHSTTSSVASTATSIAPDFNIDPTLPPPPSLNLRELAVFAKLQNPPTPLTLVFATAKILISPDATPVTLTRKILRNMMKKPKETCRNVAGECYACSKPHKQGEYCEE